MGMVYVAADPSQPGTAWAICVDDPDHADDVANTVAEFIREGAHVMRVDRDTGVEMIQKWQRPARKEK